MWLLLLYLTICIQTQASPFLASFNRTKGLSRRDCVRKPNSDIFDCDNELPSVPQIIEHLKDGAHGGDADASHSVVFYTNLGYPQSKMSGSELIWIHGWLNAKGMRDKTYWLHGGLDFDWFSEQLGWIRSHKAEFEKIYGRRPSAEHVFESCLYQAMGEAAIHPDAYLMAPKGVNWRIESIWENIEFPALTRNPNIKNIYQIDPRPPSQRGVKEDDCQITLDEPELIWSRGRGDEEKTAPWICPIPDDASQTDDEPGGKGAENS